MKNKRRKILLVIIAFGLIYLGIEIVKGFKKILRDEKNSLPSSYTLPKEYFDIISPDYLDRVQTTETFNSKIRNPISLVEFDSTLDFIIYKMPWTDQLVPKFSFKKSFWDIDESTHIVYESIRNRDFTLQIQESFVPKVSKIILSYNGGSIDRVISNDSTEYLSLKCKRLSTQDSIDAPNDILFEPRKHSVVQVLFLRKKSDLFFLMMMARNSEITMPPDLLYDVVKKN